MSHAADDIRQVLCECPCYLPERKKPPSALRNLDSQRPFSEEPIGGSCGGRRKKAVQKESRKKTRACQGEQEIIYLVPLRGAEEPNAKDLCTPARIS